jgi:hypothetical protein
MSDEDDNSASSVAVFDNSRRSREQRIKDFLEAAGLSYNDMLDSVRKVPILEDAVTDAHREMVIDLKASGCPDDVIARFLRISEPTCKRLFAWELANGLPLRTAQVVRATLTNAIQLGDTSAQLGYLKLQPDLKWGSKHKNEEVTAPPEGEDQAAQRAQNEAFVAGVTAGLMVDPDIKRKVQDKVKPAIPAQPAKAKPVAYHATVRTPKGED